MGIILLHQIRRYRIYLYAGMLVFLVMFVYCNAEDMESIFLGQYQIYGFQMVCPFLYLAACAEERRITHLQGVCTRVSANIRKQIQFSGELLILAEFLMLFSVLPAFLSEHTSSEVISFLEYCARCLLFISGTRLILIPYAGFARASYLSAAIQIILYACNNWIFRGSVTFLEMSSVRIVQWIIVLIAYFLFAINRRWNDE